MFEVESLKRSKAEKEKDRGRKRNANKERLDMCTCWFWHAWSAVDRPRNSYVDLWLGKEIRLTASPVIILDLT